MKMLAKCGLCALAAAMLAPAGAWAQSAPAAALTVLPPPSINAPGIKPVAASSTAPSPTFTNDGTAIPIPPLPSMGSDAPLDANGKPPPTVKVLKHDGNVIEQYYQGGTLYLIRVHPKHGVPYSYFVDKTHNIRRGPGAPAVNPVLYTILEWGKSGDSD